MKKILIGIFVILDLCIGYQCFNEMRQLPNTSKIHRECLAKKSQLNSLKKDTQEINPQSIEKVIAKQNINLDAIEDQTRDNIKSALDMAYNQTHNKHDFSNLKNKLPNLVGKNLSSCIIDQSRPTIISSGEQFPNLKLNDYTITFGKFDLLSRTIPVEVLVNFNTLDNQTAYGFYTLILDTKTGKIYNANYTAMTSLEKLNTGAVNNE